MNDSRPDPAPLEPEGSPEREPNASPRPSGPRRPLFVALGGVFFALGAVGAILPVLPTTPFMILAASCFVRGSPRAHRWLLSNRVFGPMIRQWQQERTITVRTKVTAITLLVLTIGSSALFAVEHLALRVMLAAIGVGVTIFLLLVPSRR